MNDDNLMSPKRQVDQGAAAGTALGTECNCLACQRNRCEPSVSSLGLAQAQIQIQPEGVEQKEAQAAPTLLPELKVMRSMLDRDIWQEVLKQRALRLVEEEMRERTAAKSARAKGVQTEQMHPSTEELIRKLPNPDAAMARFGAGLLQGQQMAAAKERAEKEKQRRSDVSYELVGEPETQRFYKAEAPQPSETVPSGVGSTMVGSAINQQHLQLDGLGDALERLEDRLRTVLDGPTVGWPAQAPKPAGPPLMEELRSVSARLEVLYGRLHGLLDRLIL